ncbi:MAG: MarR family winged helix-turn-helix transcriptional regulator [Lacisediminihabitans sp.]
MAVQPALTDAEREVWHSFYSMRRQLDRALDLQLQRDSSVSASEYEILISLHRAPSGQLRIKDLAIAIGWEKSRVSHQVARMEKRGLLTRTECESDARGSWIGLTADGRRAVLGAMPGHVAAIRRYFFDVLGAKEGNQLKELSARIVGAIGCASDEDVEPPNRAEAR